MTDKYHKAEVDIPTEGIYGAIIKKKEGSVVTVSFYHPFEGTMERKFLESKLEYVNCTLVRDNTNTNL